MEHRIYGAFKDYGIVVSWLIIQQKDKLPVGVEGMAMKEGLML